MRPVTFALASLDTIHGDRAALVVNDKFYRLDELPDWKGPATLRPLFDIWKTCFPVLEDLAGRCANGVYPVASCDARLLTPVKFPNKLVCVGAVFRDHLREMNLPEERWERMPIFLRPPTTSIVGPGDTLVRPPNTVAFDWEIELAVVIAERLKHVDPTTACAGIAGYSVGLDMTCRDFMDRNAPQGVDVVRAKAQDSMAPIGPWVRPAPFVGDPQQLRMRLSVNGQLKQDGNTVDMLYSVYEQVSTISEFITLEPGDIVFTGTPAGSGFSTGQYLQPGDRICAEIERVGQLQVTVLAGTHLDTQRQASNLESAES